MSFSMTQSLGQIKQELARVLDDQTLLAACRAAGLTWRERLLDPLTTIRLFLLQIAHGNTACSHLPHLTGQRFTPSAYCQARKRLPLAVLEDLLGRVVAAVEAETRTVGLWLGHRTFLVDGSGCSMPDTPVLQKEFGQPGNQRAGCGFPVAHLLTLFHAGTGLLRQILAAPLRSHDLSRIRDLHPLLQAGDVLLGDRAFCSFAHLALLVQQGLHGVLRIHQRQLVDFTPGRPHHVPGKKKQPKGRPTSRFLRRLGGHDQVVEWLKPKARPAWLTVEQYAALPDSVQVRELRYAVTTPGFRTKEITLVTTLLDAAVYSKDALASLYQQRWTVETDLRHLKQTMKLDVLHCKTVAGVRKELAVYALVYNLVRVVMGEAARRQQVAVERISFVDALRWLCHARPEEPLPELVVNPHRPNRSEPRVVKRRKKDYSYMRRPREELRKALLQQGVTP